MMNKEDYLTCGVKLTPENIEKGMEIVVIRVEPFEDDGTYHSDFFEGTVGINSNTRLILHRTDVHEGGRGNITWNISRLRGSSEPYSYDGSKVVCYIRDSQDCAINNIKKVTIKEFIKELKK